MNVASMAPITATQFGTARFMQTLLAGSGDAKMGVVIASSAMGGAASALVATPFEMVVIHQQVSRETWKQGRRSVPHGSSHRNSSNGTLGRGPERCMLQAAAAGCKPGAGLSVCADGCVPLDNPQSVPQCLPLVDQLTNENPLEREQRRRQSASPACNRRRAGGRCWRKAPCSCQSMVPPRSAEGL
eukprot:361775-Chlamydomonas_euryale.AAC.17